MDLRQLRYFSRIVELGSFTKAAESLHVSQPSLGVHVRNLERELRTQLMVRHSRGVEPTEAGIELFTRSKRILAEIDETQQLLRDYSGCPSGSVTLGFPPCLDAALMTVFFEKCAEALPNVDLRVVEAVNVSLVELARAGKIDLALVHYLTEAPPDLVCEKLGNEDVVFVRSARTLSRFHETIPFSEVMRHALIMPSMPHSLRDIVSQTARSWGFDVNIRFEVQSLPVLTQLIEREAGCAILPFGAVAAKVRAGLLEAVKIVDPAIEINVSTIHRASRPLSRAAAAVRALIIEELSRQIPRPCAYNTSDTVLLASAHST